MSTSHAVARCFDKASKTYDDYAHIQRRANRLLLQLLIDSVPLQGPIIDIGCGTGLSTLALSQYFSANPIEAIDISSGLLQVAAQRLKKTAVQIKQSDFDNHASYTNQYTLMFSNMALQWSTNLDSTLKLLHRHLLPNGLLAFSVPLPRTFEQLNQVNKQTLPSHQNIIDTFEQSHWVLHYHETKLWHETHKNTLAALQSIKAVGANHSNTNKPNNNFSFVRQALSHATEKKPFELSHEIGFYIAEKSC
ncbi:MAG: methyltransferase domain-containing protein [Coxiellaceae bacterium]|nr:methyltransferase domain-containing protein [Coxiellaceae bacterium]